MANENSTDDIGIISLGGRQILYLNRTYIHIANFPNESRADKYIKVLKEANVDCVKWKAVNDSGIEMEGNQIGVYAEKISYSRYQDNFIKDMDWLKGIFGMK